MATGGEHGVGAPGARRKLSKAQEISDALAIGVINTIVTLPVTCAPEPSCLPSPRA